MSAAPASARLLAARERLLRELAVLSDDAAASARSRCPYRDRTDGCTFPHGCRNQRRRHTGAVRCTGAPLNPHPA